MVIEQSNVEYASPTSDSMLRHFGFELHSREAVNAIYNELIRHNMEATEPMYVDEFTGYITMTQDPDGRWVEFSHGQDVSPGNWDG